MDIPIISIGVVQGNKLVYKQTYSEDKSANSASLFSIGSLTKSFTALAVMQLVNEGSVDLDKSIREYLPWFKIKDMDSVDKITIRTLLNQSSGFSTYDGLKNFDDWDSSEQALQRVVREFKNVSLVSAPSQQFHYSNANYQILGLLIEKVSGLSYAEYMKTKVFSIFDMKNSSASVDDTKGLTQAHTLWFSKAVQSDFIFSRVMSSAGYILSNVEDISKYLIAQMNTPKRVNRIAN